MLNYHELTMNEPRDSPQRRKQFLVISAIMAIMALHSALTAGILSPITITHDTFPGGEFIYKSMKKDYAASTGTLRTVATDLGIIEDGSSSNLIIAEDDEDMTTKDTADLLYSILLDDVQLIPGGETRFFSGVLLNKESSLANNGSSKKRLLDANKNIQNEGGGSTHSKDIKYEVGNLPKVNAAVMTHPFTAGAWSAMLQSYKIIPSFKKYAKDNGEVDKSPIIIATCSAKQKMCTYYMPLSKRDKFYMGKQVTEEYAKQFTNVGTLEKLGISGMGINVGNVFKGLKKAVGLGGSVVGGSVGKKDTSDEL